LDRSALTSIREDQQTVKGCGTTLAAGAWRDPDRAGRTFDHVAKADLVFMNEAG